MWRQESQAAIRKQTMRAPSMVTVGEVAVEWLSAAQSGVVRTRSGTPYKPSALRSYEREVRRRVLPEFGQTRLSSLTRNMVQDFVDRLVGEGCSPSAVRNAVLPLRAIYRRAIDRGEVDLNPTSKLSLPAVRPRRERVPRPSEAAALIAAVPLTDRAVWATALYAGLRRGELQALDWSHIDLEAGVIHVQRSWDPRAGLIEPKSKAGNRNVPIADALRVQLLTHRLHQGRGGQGFVFTSKSGRPFDSAGLASRARKAWAAIGFDPVGLHDCRHTYAAFMIAAGINTKALCTYMGHSTITITLDRYGHLLPGNEREAAGLLDQWLANAD